MLPPPAAQTWDSGEGSSSGVESSSSGSTSIDDSSTQVDEESDRISVSTYEDSSGDREKTPTPKRTPSKPVDAKFLTRVFDAIIGLRRTHRHDDVDCSHKATRRQMPETSKARRLFIVSVDPRALDGFEGHYVPLDDVLEELNSGTSST